jgi:riboflavin synthase
MFTGLIQAIGKVTAVDSKGADRRIRVNPGQLDMTKITTGDSIAVNGVCLTAVDLRAEGFAADVSAETLKCTTFGEITSGTRVNLEPSLTPSSPLGGHLVSGHVDGVGEVIERKEDGRSVRLNLRAPKEIARYIAAKGSICVDGVSLTVNAVAGSDFGVNIVPHTLEQTTIGAYRRGTRVNLEVDIIARYLERLLSVDQGKERGPSDISETLLAESGFISAS